MRPTTIANRHLGDDRDVIRRKTFAVDQVRTDGGSTHVTSAREYEVDATPGLYLLEAIPRRRWSLMRRARRDHRVRKPAFSENDVGLRSGDVIEVAGDDHA